MAQKEEWKMTRKEFAISQGKRVSGQSVSKTVRLAFLLHEDFVKIWIKNKPVPRYVIEEYKGRKWADEEIGKRKKTEGV